MNRHEPPDEFVERLESQISREVRRRNRSAQTLLWTPQSRKMAALAAMALVLVSMGIGAAATAAAYQAKSNERRDLLTSNYEQRAAVARQRLAAANLKLEETQRGVSLGVASQQDFLEGRVKVAEAQAQVKSLESQIEEIRITGREPLNEVSSPLVSGRDFVSERLHIDMTVPEAIHQLERLRSQDTQKRVSLGGAGGIELDVSRVRIIEVEAAVEAFRKRIEIRQMFVNRKIDAAETELRVLEVEAEQRQKTIAPRIELARKESERAAVEVRLGTGQRVDQAETGLRLQELQLQMAKAELDLALVRRQLETTRKGR